MELGTVAGGTRAKGFWAIIAAMFEGSTIHQCLVKYDVLMRRKNDAARTYTVGAWSEQEEEALVYAYSLTSGCVPNWDSIAATAAVNRTKRAMVDRWHYHLANRKDVQTALSAAQLNAPVPALVPTAPRIRHAIRKRKAPKRKEVESDSSQSCDDDDSSSEVDLDETDIQDESAETPPRKHTDHTVAPPEYDQFAFTWDDFDYVVNGEVKFRSSRIVPKLKRKLVDLLTREVITWEFLTKSTIAVYWASTALPTALLENVIDLLKHLPLNEQHSKFDIRSYFEQTWKVLLSEDEEAQKVNPYISLCFL